MLTLTQVAERFDVSPETVSAWIRSGELAAVNVSAGKVPRYRIEEQDLERFLQSRQTIRRPRVRLPPATVQYC